MYYITILSVLFIYHVPLLILQYIIIFFNRICFIHTRYLLNNYINRMYTNVYIVINESYNYIPEQQWFQKLSKNVKNPCGVTTYILYNVPIHYMTYVYANALYYILSLHNIFIYREAKRFYLDSYIYYTYLLHNIT